MRYALVIFDLDGTLVDSFAWFALLARWRGATAALAAAGPDLMFATMEDIAARLGACYDNDSGPRRRRGSL